jgi:hypothetical protein
MNLQDKYDEISTELCLTQETAIMLAQLSCVFGVSQVAKLYGLSKAELRIIVSFVKSGKSVYGKINPYQDTSWCKYTFPDMPLVKTEEYVSYSNQGIPRTRTRRVRTSKTHRNSAKYFFQCKVKTEPEDLQFLRDQTARRKSNPEHFRKRAARHNALAKLMVSGAPKSQIQALINDLGD